MSRAVSQTDRYREQNQCYLLTDSEHVLSHRHDLTLYCAQFLQKQNLVRQEVLFLRMRLRLVDRTFLSYVCAFNVHS